MRRVDEREVDERLRKIAEERARLSGSISSAYSPTSFACADELVHQRRRLVDPPHRASAPTSQNEQFMKHPPRPAAHRRAR